MAVTITQLYKGPNVEIIQVQMDIADVQAVVPHGLGKFPIVSSMPQNAGHFTDKVHVSDLGPEDVTLDKAATVATETILFLIAIDSEIVG